MGQVTEDEFFARTRSTLGFAALRAKPFNGTLALRAVGTDATQLSIEFLLRQNHDQVTHNSE